MYRYLLMVVLAAPIGVFAGEVSVSGEVSIRDRNKSVDIAFTNNDKAAIQRYYGSYRERDRDDDDRGKHGKKVPPGLAKKGGMPPGLAKRQRLPDEVKYEVLPRELDVKLSPLPSADYVRVRVGRDIAILDKRTRVVLDVAVGLPN